MGCAELQLTLDSFAGRLQIDAVRQSDVGVIHNLVGRALLGFFGQSNLILDILMKTWSNQPRTGFESGGPILASDGAHSVWSTQREILGK